MNSNTNSTSSQTPKGILALFFRIYKYILPETSKQLNKWKQIAESIPDAELKEQALQSLALKAFHSRGGSFFATANLAQRETLISLIIAFQTICDYLDNLSDRTGATVEDSRQMHLALSDILMPIGTFHDYYLFHKPQEDGGYLRKLVLTSQENINKLPQIEFIKPVLKELIDAYINHQSCKQYPKDQVSSKIKELYSTYESKHPSLTWYEMFTASGSTLAIYSLFLYASQSERDDEKALSLFYAYFPFINALHIFLDYLVDEEEDRVHDEFNTCIYFSNKKQLCERLIYFSDNAKKLIKNKEDLKFHEMIIDGLFAYYITDKKLSQQPLIKKSIKKILSNFSPTGVFIYLNCFLIRRTAMLKYFFK